MENVYWLQNSVYFNRTRSHPLYLHSYYCSLAFLLFIICRRRCCCTISVETTLEEGEINIFTWFPGWSRSGHNTTKRLQLQKKFDRRIWTADADFNCFLSWWKDEIKNYQNDVIIIMMIVRSLQSWWHKTSQLPVGSIFVFSKLKKKNCDASRNHSTSKQHHTRWSNQKVFEWNLILSWDSIVLSISLTHSSLNAVVIGLQAASSSTHSKKEKKMKIINQFFLFSHRVRLCCGGKFTLGNKPTLTTRRLIIVGEDFLYFHSRFSQDIEKIILALSLCLARDQRINIKIFTTRGRLCDDSFSLIYFRLRGWTQYLSENSSRCFFWFKPNGLT